MDQHDVPQLAGSGTGERKAFAIERSVWHCCPLSPRFGAPASVGLAMRWLIRPCVESILPAV